MFLIIVNSVVQTVKTRVINNDLNPVWNEELMLSVPFSSHLLRLVRRLSISCVLLKCNIKMFFGSRLSLSIALACHSSCNVIKCPRCSKCAL